MMRIGKIGRLTTAALLLAVVGAVGWALNHSKSVRDQAEVAKLTGKMKTVCVGRVLIDLPTQAEVRFSHLLTNGFAVSTLEESEAAFRARIAAREADITNGGAASVAAGPVMMVEARDTHVMGMIGRVLLYRKKPSGTSDNDKSMSVELHAHTNDLTFTFFKASADLARAKDGETLLARMRVRAKDEIPATPGFCLDRGVIVSVPSERSFESGAIHMSMPSYPDLAMVLNADAALGGDTAGVIERVVGKDVNNKVAELLRMTLLRKQMRRVNGILGKEVMERFRELNLATTYHFSWWAEGAEEDPRQPTLYLELQAGIGTHANKKLVSASLQKEALIALWEKISSTVHLQSSESTDAKAADPEALPGLNLPKVTSIDDLQSKVFPSGQAGTSP